MHTCTYACMRTTDECKLAHDSVVLELSCKGSAARIKSTLTAVPNTALDLYILVPGRIFRGGNLLSLITSNVDYGRFSYKLLRNKKKGHRQGKQLMFKMKKIIVFLFSLLQGALMISSACLIRPSGNILSI